MKLLVLLAIDFDGANYRHECNCPIARGLIRQYGGLWAEGVTQCARIDLPDPQEYTHARYGLPEYKHDRERAEKAGFSLTQVIRTIKLN